MGHHQPNISPAVRAALLIGACFLLGSTGWLAWLYQLMELAPASAVDALTMVVGYLMQAVGMGAYLVMSKQLATARLRQISTGCTAAFAICLAPAITTASLEAALAFGYLANVACRVFTADYLHCLATIVPHERQGLTFGGAYATTTVISWLITLPASGALLRGAPAIALCLLLGALASFLVSTTPVQSAPIDAADEQQELDRTLIPLACVAAVLASLVKNAGFSFPTADLSAGLSLELSRLLYGVGLVVAGLVCDRRRSFGALCCITALVTPFLMLALSGMDAPGALLWSVDYLLFGLFAVYRVILFVDLACSERRPSLAVMGLLLGRTGDALGTALCLALANMPLVLVSITAVLFALTAASFFLLYQRLYAAVPEAQPSEQELFDRFSARHDLSAREREVLRLVLSEHTNAQIAGELFVSEATVKFHVRNLLKKTGCKNRLEVHDLYAQTR